MKGPGFLRRLSAYRDGALSGPARQRLQQQLEADPESAGQLHEMEMLGEAVRVAWSDGPEGPDPDRLLASIRPALRAVDAEFDAQVRPRLRDRLAGFQWPVPSRVFAGAALAGLLVVGILPFVGIGAPPSRVQPPIQPEFAQFRAPDSIYDLGHWEVPVIVFEAEDGATVVWMVDEEPDLLSHAHFSEKA